MTSNKIKNLIRGLLTPGRLWQRWETNITAMLTTSGIIAIVIPVLFSPNVSLSSAITYSVDTKLALLAKSYFSDGIYLYGKSPKREQIGREYIVFQVRQGQVIGFIYLSLSLIVFKANLMRLD